MAKPKILRHGSRGPEVRQVQEQLNKFICPHIDVDGKFGNDTEAAVRVFQKAAGFRGRDIDGEVGPKTTVALFQVFDVSICGTLKPNPAKSKLNAPAPANPPKPAMNNAPKPIPVPANQGTANPPELPKRYQLSSQFGYQLSRRDGPGLQYNWGWTFRSRDYFPSSGPDTIYHGMHNEVMISPTLGIPLPPSSIYTGQLSVQVSPVTDWLVLWDRLHLLTPSVGVYGQIPFNPRDANPMMDDPATHPRLGGYVGLELFHFDIIKDTLSIGISGQESGYWDFANQRIFWDPSVLGFLNWQIGVGPRYQPLPK